jgi:hypothetical protein
MMLLRLTIRGLGIFFSCLFMFKGVAGTGFGGENNFWIDIYLGPGGFT